jgi:hypothetical protein
MRLPSQVLLLAIAAALAGCSQNIWVSGPHPLTTPEQIRIYTQRPSHYERLGTITHLGELDPQWEQRPDAAAVFADLLKEAAAMGANGLLLLDDTTMADAKVSVTYQGTPYTLPIIGKSKTVVVQGIFVSKE